MALVLPVRGRCHCWPFSRRRRLIEQAVIAIFRENNQDVAAITGLQIIRPDRSALALSALRPHFRSRQAVGCDLELRNQCLRCRRATRRNVSLLLLAIAGKRRVGNQVGSIRRSGRANHLQVDGVVNAACRKRQRWIPPAGTVRVGCTTPFTLVNRPLVSQMVGESSCRGKFSTAPRLTKFPGAGAGQVQAALAGE
jgi:hypothetical protein